LFFIFYTSVRHRHLPSFPTRRSSDLAQIPSSTIRSTTCFWSIPGGRTPETAMSSRPGHRHMGSTWRRRRTSSLTDSSFEVRTRRSEEHTSELQSRSDLVCRLLLEKKK